MLQYLSINEWTGGLGGTVRSSSDGDEDLTKALKRKPIIRRSAYETPYFLDFPFGEVEC